MTTLHDLLPDAASILALEPEELAGLALELINETNRTTPSRLHPSSFTSPESIGAFSQDDSERIRFAMAEAWCWLIREGLIAPTPGDSSGWHFVTRRGKQLKNREGTEAYRKSVLLPRSMLHPSIAKECCDLCHY